MKKLHLLSPVKDEEFLVDSSFDQYTYNIKLQMDKSEYTKLQTVLDSRIFEMPNGTNLYIHDKSYPQSRIRNWMKSQSEKALTYNIVRKPDKATCVMIKKEMLLLSTRDVYAIKVQFDNSTPIVIDGITDTISGEWFVEVEPNPVAAIESKKFDHVEFPLGSDNKIYKLRVPVYYKNGNCYDVSENHYDDLMGDIMDIAAIASQSDLSVSFIYTEDVHTQTSSSEGLSYSSYLTVKDQIASGQEHLLELAASFIAEHNFEKSAYWLSQLNLADIKRTYSMSLNHNKIIKDSLTYLPRMNGSLSSFAKVVNKYNYCMTKEQKEHAIKTYKHLTDDLIFEALNKELSTFLDFKSNSFILNLDMSILGFDPDEKLGYTFLNELDGNDTENMGKHEHQHDDVVEAV
jgi:hypothetical protein